MFAGSEVKIPNVLREDVAKAPMAFINKVSDSKGLKAHTKLAELSPIVMLLKFLSEPDIDTWRSYAMLRSLCWLDQTRMKDLEEKNYFDEQKSAWPSQFVDSFSESDIIFCSSNRIEDSQATMSTFIAGEQSAVTELNPEALVLSVVFDPINTDGEFTKVTWQKLLQILNIGQFLPKFFAGTRKGIENGDFAQLEWGTRANSMESSEWDKIVKLADEDIEELIHKLASGSAPLPEVGYELVDSRGAGIGEAELAWEEIKVAFLMEYQLEESREGFEKCGWDIVTLDDDMDVLMNKLRGRK